MAREIRRTIRFDADVWNQLEAATASSGRTMTAIVNEAVKVYLLNQNQPNRSKSIEERLSAIEERLGISGQ